MKLKVNKAKLIAALQKNIAEAKAADKELSALAVDRWKLTRAESIERLKAELAEWEATSKAVPPSKYLGSTDYGGSRYLPSWTPSRSAESSKADQLETVIRKLALTDEDVLTLDENDSYLRYV